MCSTGATSQPGSGIGEPVEEAAAGERRDHCGKETSGIIVWGQAVLPIKLAIFLFQVLVKIYGESEEDKELGFKAALSALSKWYMYEKGAHLLLREVIPSKML